MALHGHLVPSLVTEYQQRTSCLSRRRSGGLARFSVQFPPEQEEEVKHVSRINGVCRRRRGMTMLWHTNPWCLCAVWTSLARPNGLWTERGSTALSSVLKTTKKKEQAGEMPSPAHTITFWPFYVVKQTRSSPINSTTHPPPPPSPPTGPSTFSITLLLSLPSLNRWDLIWLYYGDHLGDCTINQSEDGRCGQLPVNQPRGHWSFDGDRAGEKERDSMKWTREAAPLSLTGLVEEKHLESRLLVSLPLFFVSSTNLGDERHLQRKMCNS